MGQVPVDLEKTLPLSRIPGIIGDGRMARHFSHYLNLAGVPHQVWSRQIGQKDHSRVDEALANCSPVLLLIRDSAIEPFLRELPAAFRSGAPSSGGSPRQFIHFSGSLVTGEATGFHPLMTFGPELYTAEVYREVPFLCEAGGPGFAEIFPSLPNPHFQIKPELKPLYHALCVLSGNFTTLLWQKFFKELEGRFHVPREAAFPYLRAITANLLQNSATALTGPIARRDFETLARNREALTGDRFQGVFQAFIDAAAKGDAP